MAVATLYHGDPCMVDYTPSADVDAGDVIVVGNGVRIAHRDIAEGALGALAIRGGVYIVPKATGSALNDGALVYWDATDGNAQADADTGTNKVLGFVVETAASAATEVKVLHTTPLT